LFVLYAFSARHASELSFGYQHMDPRGRARYTHVAKTEL
jgi:hypothetical protein